MKNSHWFLIIAVVALGYVFLKGGDEKFSGAQIDYDRLAVSQGLSQQAVDLNLEKDLDVSLLPGIGKQVIREAAQKGLKEQAFLEYAINEVGNRVREISTIDLNGDDVVDPILVKPEPQEGEQYALLSLRVPAHDAYPLPSAGDGEAWKKVETLEVATMSIALNDEALTVQAQGNQHVYPNSAGQTHVVRDSTPSFMSMYFTMRMMDWMFFPPMFGFWGPGYGYGGYRQMGVGNVASQREARASNRGYEKSARTNTSAIRSRSGSAPTSQYSRAYASKPPRSLNQLKSSASFQRRQAASTGSGGFGRQKSQMGSRSGFSNQRKASGFGGFGRGASRSGFGGGGLRFGK